MKKYESLESAVKASENDELEDTFLVDANLSEETINTILEIIKVHKDPDIGMSSVLNEAICSYYDNEINKKKPKKNKKDKQAKKVKKIDPINIDNDGEEEYEVGGTWFDGEVESGGRLVREYFFDGLTESNVEKNKNSIEASKENKDNPFDDEVNLNAKYEDMSMSLIKEYLYDTGNELYEETSKLSKEELLRKLDMIDDELRPKNIGLLMFSDSPEKFIPGCQLELVHFLGTTYDDFIEKTFHGPIYEQIKAVLRYIENNLIKSKNIDGEIFFNYPLKAIKEAIINAFYHRNYAQNTPIEVRIDEEKIVVVSYPGPDKFIEKEDIDKGEVTARIYRNRRIGEYLESLGLANGNAVGLARMIKAMKDNNSSEPIFETDDSRAYFIVKLYENTCYFDDEYQELYVDEKQQKDVLVSVIEDQILELLADGPLSKKEISEYLGYENVPGNIKRALCKLLEKKLITYTIPENVRSKGQKYRIL